MRGGWSIDGMGDSVGKRLRVCLGGLWVLWTACSMFVEMRGRVLEKKRLVYPPRVWGTLMLILDGEERLLGIF